MSACIVLPWHARVGKCNSFRPLATNFVRRLIPLATHQLMVGHPSSLLLLFGASLRLALGILPRFTVQFHVQQLSSSVSLHNPSISRPPAPKLVRCLTPLAAHQLMLGHPSSLLFSLKYFAGLWGEAQFKLFRSFARAAR